MKPKIKICGITSLENAKQIALLDIDYLGFIINYPKVREVYNLKKQKKLSEKLKK